MAVVKDSPDVSRRLFTLDSLLAPPADLAEWIKTNPRIGTPVGEVSWPSMAELARMGAPCVPKKNGKTRTQTLLIAHAFGLPRYMLARAMVESGWPAPRASRGYRRHVRRIKAERRKRIGFQGATVAP